MTVPKRMLRAGAGSVLALSASLATAAGEAAPPASLAEAISGGDIALQFRYRYEDVDQDNALDDAWASTLKSRLGYTSMAYRGWQFQLEVDDVSPIGADDEYNSTSNNEAGRSVIADPDGTEINQAWIAYSGIAKTTLKAGRQRIALDNERFIGAVGWRQNEQTHDAVSLQSGLLRDTTLNYAWIDNVNRVFGPDDGTTPAWLGDWDSSIHLVNIGYSGLPFGTLTVYDYLMDIADADAQSNATLGVRFAGKHALSQTTSLLYAAEYARQQDHADNPVSYEADYWLLEAGVALPRAVTLTVGQEVLEGDADRAGRAFRTPLATLHKFQGFADMFLATPDAGVQDRYALASIVVLGATASLAWHDFEADDGGASFGEELDLSLSRKFGKHLTTLLKYADYNADGFAVDTRKIWVQLQLDI